MRKGEKGGALGKPSTSLLVLLKEERGLIPLFDEDT